MKRLIIILVAGTIACTTLFAIQPIERTVFSQAQIDQIEKCVVNGLQSTETTQQVDAAMMLHRVREVASAHDWDRCIIPLMHILNDEDNQPPVRLLAAMVLHELRTERGDFAISRNALFTDNARVKRYCIILTRARLIGTTKL